MSASLSVLDGIIVVVYAVGLIGIATWVSRERPGHEKNTEDYFLAGKSLPWWAIGASLIAANISAEQIIGMSGSGYAIGLGIASYEWMAAITLLLVGKYLLPIFLARGIYTMPQFLEQRYDRRVRVVLAVFWIGVYIFINLTSILWLGALAIHTISGLSLFWSLALLGLFSLTYSLYGGLKAVAMTDLIQVALLVFGGLLIAYLALNALSDDTGALRGFLVLLERAPEKFDMILSKDNPHYVHLPGLSVLLGGMWIMNLSYWGFNQYIIQRALAAKSIREAQKGIAFAAFLKIIMPIIVVLPGIAAAVMLPDLPTPDHAYPQMLNLVPAGLKGLVFAALIAAIVSSLASMMNSVATIFTMDLYRHAHRAASQHQLVAVGRTAVVVAVVLAMLCAQPLLGQFDQAFQFIQEFTGFFTPGICVIFLLGMFWSRTTTLAALVAAIGSVLLSISIKLSWPELPFMDRVALVFVLCTLMAVLVSYRWPRSDGCESEEGVVAMKFSTASEYNIAALACLCLVSALYVLWW